jgi:pimeloyl-ACP methyl ester carboxylesterase
MDWSLSSSNYPGKEQYRTMATDASSVTHRFIEVNGIRIHLAEQGAGPLILLCHGFPELWYSWRYQMPALSQAGYHVVAPDLRGFGQTDQPAATEAYTLLHLVGDLVGIVEALEEEQAILVGHDWGGLLAWHAALLRPDRFPALVAISSPYTPRGPLYGPRSRVKPSEVWQQRWGDQFFYQTAMLVPGRAEGEYSRDVRATLLRMLYGLSADALPEQRWHPILPDVQSTLLNSAGRPETLPPWLSEADLDLYTVEYERSGFTGGLNWYRNMDRNWELLAAYSGAKVRQPALFIWGDEDPLLEIAGVARNIERQMDYVPRLRQMQVNHCGHWVQQERAQEVSAAVLSFLHDI